MNRASSSSTHKRLAGLPARKSGLEKVFEAKRVAAQGPAPSVTLTRMTRSTKAPRRRPETRQVPSKLFQAHLVATQEIEGGASVITKERIAGPGRRPRR